MITPEAAVQRCLLAYNRACEIDDARNDHSPESLRRVNRAWRCAMPFLTNDPDAIDAFIACVTHGLVLEILPLAEASKLLYAAQVAIGSRRARQQSLRDQAKAHPTPSPSPAQQLTAPAPSAPVVPPPSLADPAPASPSPRSEPSKVDDPIPTPSPESSTLFTSAMPPPAGKTSQLRT